MIWSQNILLLFNVLLIVSRLLELFHNFDVGFTAIKSASRTLGGVSGRLPSSQARMFLIVEGVGWAPPLESICTVHLKISLLYLASVSNDLGGFKGRNRLFGFDFLSKVPWCDCCCYTTHFAYVELLASDFVVFFFSTLPCLIQYLLGNPDPWPLLLRAEKASLCISASPKSEKRSKITHFDRF